MGIIRREGTKAMRYKPLILIFPFILVISILVFIDEPINEIENSNVAIESSAQDESSDVDSINLSLVVGKSGSMEGGGEPIYREPDKNSIQVAELQYNCAVMQEKDQNAEGWIHVNLIDKGDGYVAADAVELCHIEEWSNSSTRMDIINDACLYLGLRFKQYGTSLENGIDCSNFVSKIYGINDLDVPDTPIGLRDFGIKVDERKAQVGDLVFYDKANDGDGHVGLYLGDGFIINSSGHSGNKYPEGGVRICRLLYADRDSYQIYNILDPAEVSNDAK